MDKTPGGSTRCLRRTSNLEDPAHMLRAALSAYGLNPRQLRRIAGMSPANLHWALRSPDPPPELRALLDIQMAMLTPLRREPIRSSVDIAGLQVVQSGHCDQEQLLTVCLDSQNCVQDIAPVYRGNVTGAVVRLAEVFKRAMQLNSSAIILAHNHPASSMVPSQEDIDMTKCCIHLGRWLAIDVLDHLIIGAGQWISVYHWLDKQQGHGGKS